MAYVDVEGGGGLKREREEDMGVVLCDYARGVDEAAAPSNKRQCGGIGNSDHVCVLDVYVPRGGSPCSNECLSAINGGEEEAENKVESSVLRELEDCLVGDKQVGSSERAVSEENAARVLRSLEEELGLSESEGQTVVSSLPSADEEAPCTAAFATWGDDVWNMHGFSSADLSVGCSSGSTLTGDDFVCERFDVHPMLNHENNADPVDLCFRLGGSDERLDGPSSTGAVKGILEDTEKKSVLNESSSVTTVGVAVGGTLEGLHNAISWALEEGFDDYSGFSHIGVGDDWITPDGNLDFLLDSTTVYATTAPFVEEGVPL